MAAMEMKIRAKTSGPRHYIAAARSFLTGVPAREAVGDKDAAEAKPPIDELKISGLGDAVSIVIAVAQACEAEGLGKIMDIRTDYPNMPDGRGCAKVVIEILRTGAVGDIVPLIKLKGFPSVNIRSRPVHIWLPDGYEQDTEPYSVLYMHDGGNLFLKKYTAFGEHWDIAPQLQELMTKGLARKTIVVGVFNGETSRFQEYCPEAVVDKLPEASRKKLFEQPVYGGDILSKRYAKFLVEELKPYIDKTYRTKPDRDNTFIMGSSMGGLISLYTLALYPETFVGAGCVSSHWPLSIDDPTLESPTWPDEVMQAWKDCLPELLPSPGTHRFWFDYGDQTLDRFYEPYQKMVDGVLSAKGFTQGKDVITKAFPGTNHSEPSWRARVKEPLEFLLRK